MTLISYNMPGFMSFLVKICIFYSLNNFGQNPTWKAQIGGIRKFWIELNRTHRSDFRLPFKFKTSKLENNFANYEKGPEKKIQFKIYACLFFWKVEEKYLSHGWRA